MGTGGVRAARRAVPACRSWSPASSRSTCSRGSAGRAPAGVTARPRSRTRTPRAVAAEGNRAGAGSCSPTCSRSTDRNWRGIGMIPQSAAGGCAERIAEFDAEQRFDVGDIHTAESPVCRAARCCRGCIKPHECAAFGTTCTPRNPLGAPMVSSEGACAAYYLLPAAARRRAVRRGRRVEPTDPRSSADRARLRGLGLPGAAARRARRSCWATAAAGSCRRS